MKELAALALRALDAEKYADDHHRFRPVTCPACGFVPQSLVVEQHSGSTRSNFRGVISGRCSQCAGEYSVFRFTGPHRRPLRSEEMACACAASFFWVGIGERIEGEAGLPGFFDEGVVVARCAGCARERVVVYFD